MAIQKYQHYVPQTYLNKWLDNKNQLHLYDNKNKLIRSCKTDRIFGENNLYTKNISYFIICSEEEKKEIFKCLKGYKVYLHDKELVNENDFTLNYYLFDKWIIQDSLGNERRKNKFKCEIEHSRILTIENLLKKYEDQWNDIYNALLDIINNKTDNKKIDDFINNHLFKLKKMVFIQEWRSKDKIEFFKEAINSSIGFMKEEMEEVYDEMIKDFPKAMFLKKLESFLYGRPEILFDKNFKLFEMAQLKIFVATGYKKFLTNDRPILYVENKKLEKGIYYPISPQITCGFVAGDRSKIFIEQMPYNSIRELNKIIKKNSNEFYISSEVR